jgi:hypothetical protein
VREWLLGVDGPGEDDRGDEWCASGLGESERALAFSYMVILAYRSSSRWRAEESGGPTVSFHCTVFSLRALSRPISCIGIAGIAWRGGVQPRSSNSAVVTVIASAGGGVHPRASNSAAAIESGGCSDDCATSL